MDLIVLLAAVAALVVGSIAGYFIRNTILFGKAKELKATIEASVKEAEEHKRQAILDGREEAFKIRSAAENEIRDRRSDLNRMDHRLSQREETVDRRDSNLGKKERSLKQDQQEVEKIRGDIEAVKSQYTERLETISGITSQEATDIVLKNAEDEAKHELSLRYWQLEKEAKDEAEQNARKVITLAINRLAADVVSESSTAVVSLPNDEMKGRLIGRAGRNIRTLEAMTGVDIIVDDTPEIVTISCFDPVRREIARLALDKLVLDGRIQPTRIEEVVEKSKVEIDETIQREGEQAVFDSGVKGLNPDLVKLLGRLKYRFSYGENILNHSVEVSLIAGMLAAEIGADIHVSKAGGLLHDIGKALSHEVEGPHAEIGADIAKKYGISHPVHRAIMEHHDEEHGSIEAFLVQAADAISAARPGSRKESLEQYVKRLEELEGVVNHFPNIEKAFAIQAGREARVVVKPESVDDMEASVLAKDIAKRIEDELVYPGQIKVTVIRETRSTEYAR